MKTGIREIKKDVSSEEGTGKPTIGTSYFRQVVFVYLRGSVLILLDFDACLPGDFAAKIELARESDLKLPTAP